MIKNAKHIGSLFQGNDSKVLGLDGAYSFPIGEGKVFWTFGDTLLGPERKGYDPEKIYIDDWLNKDVWAKDNINMLANTGAITTSHIITLLSEARFLKSDPETAGEMISPPDRHTEDRYRPFWPMAGLCINGIVYIFYLMVDCGANQVENEMDITVYGTGLLKSEYPYRDFEQICPQSNDYLQSGTLNNPLNETQKKFIFWNNEPRKTVPDTPLFGVGICEIHEENMLYIYGSRIEKIGDTIQHGVCLSKVSYDKIEDPSAYVYYSGKKDNLWTDRIEEAVSIFYGNANELSVNFNPYLNKYTAFYSYAGVSEKGVTAEESAFSEIHMRLSDAPEGPWSDPQLVYKAEKSIEKDYCYAAKEHPEYREENGKKTYLTFVSHQRYYPEVLEVEFE